MVTNLEDELAHGLRGRVDFRGLVDVDEVGLPDLLL